MRLALLLALLAQSVAADLCTLEGRVSNSATGEPVRNTTLILTPEAHAADSAGFTTSTDADGKFAMTRIEPGRYTLQARHSGFSFANYRGVLTLDPGQKLAGLDFKIVPFGVISGRVVDAEGEPMQGATVSLARKEFTAWGRRLVRFSNGSTDDRGQYRIYNIPPGRYFVTASAPAAVSAALLDRSATPPPDEAYMPALYPGAAGLDVRPGIELHDIDFKLLKAPTVKVRGRVQQASPGARVEVWLAPRDSGPLLSYRGTTAASDGRFEISGVFPGDYDLEATARTGDRSAGGRIPLTVGTGDLENVSVTISPGLTLTGRFRIEGDAPQVPGRPGIRLISRDRDWLAPTADDRTFRLQDLPARPYTVAVAGLPDNYYVKSLFYGEREHLEASLDLSAGLVGPVTVVLSPNAAQVSGIVQDAKTQQPVAGATVVLVPQEPDRRDLAPYYRVVTADQRGAFTASGIPPGDYRVFARQEVEPGAWFDPDFLRAAEPSSVHLAAAENGRHRLDLLSSSAP